MLRSRLASLALTCGLLFSMSGCCAFCEDGRLFPRLFRTSSFHPGLLRGHAAECPCPPGGPGIDGPIMTAPQFPPTPIPITNVPSGQPPQIFKVPQAPATPYHP